MSSASSKSKEDLIENIEVAAVGTVATSSQTIAPMLYSPEEVASLQARLAADLAAYTLPGKTKQLLCLKAAHRAKCAIELAVPRITESLNRFIFAKVVLQHFTGTVPEKERSIINSREYTIFHDLLGVDDCECVDAVSVSGGRWMLKANTLLQSASIGHRLDRLNTIQSILSYAETEMQMFNEASSEVEEQSEEIDVDITVAVDTRVARRQNRKRKERVSDTKYQTVGKRRRSVPKYQQEVVEFDDEEEENIEVVEGDSEEEYVIPPVVYAPVSAAAESDMSILETPGSEEDTLCIEEENVELEEEKLRELELTEHEAEESVPPVSEKQHFLNLLDQYMEDRVTMDVEDCCMKHMELLTHPMFVAFLENSTEKDAMLVKYYINKMHLLEEVKDSRQ